MRALDLELAQVFGARGASAQGGDRLPVAELVCGTRVGVGHLELLLGDHEPCPVRARGGLGLLVVLDHLERDTLLRRPDVERQDGTVASRCRDDVVHRIVGAHHLDGGRDDGVLGRLDLGTDRTLGGLLGAPDGVLIAAVVVVLGLALAIDDLPHS